MVYRRGAVNSNGSPHRADHLLHWDCPIFDKEPISCSGLPKHIVRTAPLAPKMHVLLSNSESFGNHLCTLLSELSRRKPNARIRGFLSGGSGLESGSSDCSTCYEGVSLHLSFPFTSHPSHSVYSVKCSITPHLVGNTAAVRNTHTVSVS